MRLVGGDGSYGVVEVQYDKNGDLSWGNICNNGINNNAAATVEALCGFLGQG